MNYETDAQALKALNPMFWLERSGAIYHKPGHVITDGEAEAIVYLTSEWDYAFLGALT